MSGNATTRTTKRLSELPAGTKIRWRLKTYIVLGSSNDERQKGRVFLYAPSGKIARWPEDQLIALVRDEWVVYSPTVWDDAGNG